MVRFLKRLAAFYPLAPKRLSSCFVEGAALFEAIETERIDQRRRPDALRAMAERGEDVGATAPGRSADAKNRAYTILGANRSWREHALSSSNGAPGQALATRRRDPLILALGRRGARACRHAARPRRSPWMRQWNVQTLEPVLCASSCRCANVITSAMSGSSATTTASPISAIATRERRSSPRFVAIEWLSPGRIQLKADSGATVRKALDFLARSNQELYVVPNYSYVCLGTSFFVPIHGSAVDYSTVADTICRVVLYDPDSDRIISAARDDTAFREHVYNQQSRAVLLRLYILAKAKSRYFVRRETLEKPSAAELSAALSDPRATNVEIRQAHAASARVTVARYYTDPGETTSPALELPRNALGRLWDRLEENPITSYLMHALSRRVAWHTELFFTPAQFERVLANSRPAPPAQNPAKISTTRRAAPFSLPRRRLRFGRPVHVSHEQAPLL